MSQLNEQLQVLVQRSGISNGNLATASDRSAFQSNVKSDIANLIDQLNTVYRPLVSTLIATTTTDALDYGLCGNSIFTHIGATQADAEIYYTTALSRPRVIKESFDLILSELSRLENDIAKKIDFQAYDDAALYALVQGGNLNAQQIALDAFGTSYHLDADGLKNLTYPLAEIMDAFGALVDGYVSTGLTYASAYPTLSIPMTSIGSLAAYLGYIRTFIGMDSEAAVTDYSTHGAITTVVDGESLELSIQKLDAAVATAGGIAAFSTAAGTTSNAPGAYATDNLVFGSPEIDDDADATHDSRMSFEKSTGAFRAGIANLTQWDFRGIGSAAFGKNNRASGGYSSVLGGEDHQALGDHSSILGGVANIVNGDLSVIGAGGGAGVSNTVNGDNSIIGAGASNTLSGHMGMIGSGQGNNIEAGSDFCLIGGGENNHILDGSDWGTIGGGVENHILADSAYATISGGSGNYIGAASQRAFIGGGSSNTVNATDASILGGSSNTIDDGAVYSAVVSGTRNLVTVEGQYGTAHGEDCKVSRYGEVAQASGTFVALTPGTAQRSILVARAACPVQPMTAELFLDGATKRFTVPADTSIRFKIRVLGSGLDGSGNIHSGAKDFDGVVTRTGAAVPVLQDVVEVELGAPSTNGWALSLWTFTLTAAGDYIELLAGTTSPNYPAANFVASIEIVEAAVLVL